jgi:antitoxin FitA
LSRQLHAAGLASAFRGAILAHAKLMQTAPMAILQIRDLPDDVYQGIAAAARAEQRSLSQQAVVELRRALGLGGADRRAAMFEHLRASGRRLPPQAPSPEVLQRNDRDGR